MNRKAHKVRRVVVAPALSTDPLQAHNGVNSRSQNRGISRGNSLKGNSLVQQQDSRCISDGKSFTARSKELDLSESSYTADCDDSAECCNMKLMDLQGEKFRVTYYNHFEERIVEERQVNKLKHKGRSIGSIRNNPNESLLTLTKLSKLTSGSSSMRGIVSFTTIFCHKTLSLLHLWLDNDHRQYSAGRPRRGGEHCTFTGVRRITCAEHGPATAELLSWLFCIS